MNDSLWQFLIVLACMALMAILLRPIIFDKTRFVDVDKQIQEGKGEKRS